MFITLRKKSWRFFLFQNCNKNFCFDSFTHKIYKLDDDLYNLLKNNEFREIRKVYKLFFLNVLKQNPFKIQRTQEDKCYVTINLSNNCNLDCKYCYRKKSENTVLRKTELKKIFEYIKNVYFKSASEYVFSLCYTSESSLDLDSLKYIDYLIGQNEGYLFSYEQLSMKSAELIFSSLPAYIKDKYCSEKNPIIKLNKILEKEELWKSYDFSNNAYLSKVLTPSKYLSYSRRIMANRQILNALFPEFYLEKKISYISMSFMTNATRITDDYIDFLKSILIDSIYVSLDGLEENHNKNRIYKSGKGSYQDVIQGIKKLQSNGIRVIPSVVITPDNYNLKQILEEFINPGFDSLSFNLIRGNSKENAFSYKTMNEFIEIIKNIFSEIYESVKKTGKSKKLLILKNTILFSYMKSLYYGNYITKRCNWGENLVIDSKGDLYNCNSVIGIKKAKLGNYKSNKSKKNILRVPYVNRSRKCKRCYAKYLCGGTCYAEQYIKNSHNSNIECYFHKCLINENFFLYTKLKNENLLDCFMKELK